MSELPDGWAWATLQQIAAREPNAITDGPFGSNLKSSDYVSEGVRVVRLGNLGVGEFIDTDRVYVTPEKYDTLRKHEVFAGDLIVAALAEPVGRCVEVPAFVGPAIVKADCVRLKVDQRLDRKFVLFCLNSPDGQKRAEAAAHGIGRLRINLGDLRELALPIAPVSEQHRIVSKIESLTARSRRAKEALDAVPALLERFRQSVLASAFRGDLTADWREKNPDVEPAEVLLKRIRAERRRRWEEAELAKMRAKGKVPGDDRWKEKYEEPAPVDAEGLPELPEGWCWASIAELVDSLKNGIATKPDRETGLAILRISAVRPMSVNSLDVRYLHADESYSEYELIPGDVLFTRYNGNAELVGVAGMIRDVASPLVYPDKLIRARVLRDLVSPAYFEAAANTLSTRAFISTKRKTAAGQVGISGSDLRMAPVPLAPMREQLQIVAIVNKFMAIANSITRSVGPAQDELTALDRSILAKAFRGELVAQNPSDEPASVLLERLRGEGSSTTKEKPQKTGRRGAGARKASRLDDAG